MSNERTIQQRVTQIVSGHLNIPVDRVLLTTSFLDLGDSLDFVEIIIALEDEFLDEIKGVIPESHADKLQTVGDVVDYIRFRSLS